MQDRLKELAQRCTLLEKQQEERKEELAKLEEDLVTGKAEHGKLAAQAQELRDKRLFEESRLRARGLELHSRVLQVSQENNRLEVLRRDEDLQISRNQETILE